jgi:signal transduction protein with GAF and PtsI domain
MTPQPALRKGGKIMSNEMKYLKLFKDLCKKINSSLDLGEVLKSISENAAKMLNVKGCAVFLLDKDRKRLSVSASYGLSDDYINKGPLDSEKSMVECLRGKQVMVSDVVNDSRIQYPEEARKEGIASILSVPMSIRGKIIGVLRIYTSGARYFFDIENEFISGLAEIGSIGIENARMFHHLKNDYEKLMSDVHQWFDYGRMP